MRSFFARLAVIGTVGAALTGCGTSGTSLPVGAFPGASGGGPTPVSNQGAPGGVIPSVLIDGGVLSIGSYVGYPTDTTATDTQSTANAGTDVAPTKGSGPVAIDSAGSHSISFSTGSTTQTLKFTGPIPGLVAPALTPGAILATNYGAIALYSNYVAPPGAASPTIAIELVGGSGQTKYDVRIGCAQQNFTDATVHGTFNRYVCDLPAYGSPSGAYATTVKVTAAEVGTTAPGTFSLAPTGQGIVGAVLPGATGTFTPLGAPASATPTLYVVVSNLVGVTPTNFFGLDYVYAEQGTQ